MGLKDDFAVLFGSGLDMAGKQAEKIRLQAELAKTKSAIDTAYASLGRTIVQGESRNEVFLRAYGTQINSVRELERRAADMLMRINELSQAEPASDTGASLSGQMPVGSCPACGTKVTVDAVACPVCGNDLAALKAKYSRCPSCGAYYEAGTKFCIVCGSRTGSVPVAAQKSRTTLEAPDTVERVPETLKAPANPVCPGCGSVVSESDVFCGSCGARIRE